MGILEEMESIKYRSFLDLIKMDEAYDKKKNSITGLDAFVLLHRRYLKLKNILSPLKDKIGNGIEIVDIDFSDGMQDEVTIAIKYTKKNKSHILSISSFYDQIEVNSSDVEIENETFIQNNKKIFQNIFKGIEEYHLDSKIYINTASKKYVISDLADSLTLKDTESKVFMVNTKHSLYEKNRLLINRIDCNYPKLKELLEKEDNILNIYNHIHIYEEDLDNVLIKKLT